MKNNKLFIAVGLPGSGKSYYGKLNKGHYQMFDEVLSSDEYRLKLFNKLVTDKKENDVVFDTLYTDMINYLKAGKSVYIDATNLTRKSRAKIIKLVRDNKIDCEIIAVLFETELSLVLKQNKMRAAVVPEEVIHKMLCSFEIPFEGEGFDAINVVFHKDHKLESYMDYLNLMMGKDQDNPHHNLDLYSHCAKCHDYIINKTDNKELIFASILHDIGKLYTKTYNEEKGYSQYIGHQNYGAYLALFLDYSPDVLFNYQVAFYINYHMDPYKLVKAKDSTKEKYKNLFGIYWNDLLLLHEADIQAH